MGIISACFIVSLAAQKRTHKFPLVATAVSLVVVLVRSLDRSTKTLGGRGAIRGSSSGSRAVGDCPPRPGGLGGDSGSAGASLRVGRDKRSIVRVGTLGDSGGGGRADGAGGARSVAELTNTGVGLDVGSNFASSHDGDVGLTRGPAADHRAVTTGESTGADQSVGDTGASEGAGAGGNIAGVHGEYGTGVAVGQERSVDLDHHITLDQSTGVLANIEGMASVVVPVVVVRVPEAVELKLGGTARSVVDVVVGEGDLVIVAVSETR